MEKDFFLLEAFKDKGCNFSQKIRSSKYTFSNFIFLVLFNAPHGSILCHLFFVIYTWTTYQMITHPISNSFVDLLLSFITLNAKTWAYELNSKFQKQIWMNIISFVKSDLNKQALALEVTFSRVTKSYYSQTCFNLYIKNLSEWEIECLSSYFKEKCSNVYKIRKSGFIE